MDPQHVTAGEARSAAEHAARTSYGRLIAALTAPSGDLQLAEDSLATAFERALAIWAASGVPDNPEAWLLTVARNQQRDTWKSAAHRLATPLADASAELRALSALDDLDLEAIPDKRLELLFVCAHPAVDPAARTPLMLQVVLGFDAAQIATAFAVPTRAMAQRLVRAKRRIKDARIRFAVPDRSAMSERLPPVLEAVYGCYAIAWSDSDDADGLQRTMAGEARYLAVTLAGLLPDDAEAWGLAALVTLSMARAPGRGRAQFVPLDEQDPGNWDRTLITEGEAYLKRSSSAARLGRFQLEAAIQAVHLARARTGVTDLVALRTLHEALDVLAPTLGSRVALATTIARTDGPDAGLTMLDELGHSPSATGFQPYWTARGHLLDQAHRTTEAVTAYRTAAALTSDAVLRAHLEHQARRLTGA